MKIIETTSISRQQILDQKLLSFGYPTQYFVEPALNAFRVKGEFAAIAWGGVYPIDETVVPEGDWIILEKEDRSTVNVGDDLTGRFLTQLWEKRGYSHPDARVLAGRFIVDDDEETIRQGLMFVYSDVITHQLRKQIGDWDKATLVQRVSRWTGTGYVNFIYHIDGKWEVTVMTNCGGGNSEFYDALVVKDLEEVKEAQRDFGRRCADLAKEVSIPWEIAVFAGNVESDSEAIRLLTIIKAAKGKAHCSSLRHELACGINRRTSAIRQLIGDEVFDAINCRGQRATKTLASYLTL